MFSKRLDTRREFLKKSASATMGFTVLPPTSSRPPCPGWQAAAEQADQPGSDRCGRTGFARRSEICSGGKARPVAFCDVDFGARRVEDNLKRYPGVRQFKDFRVMLEEMDKDIDAVSVVTPDHTHFPAAMLAMSLGKHVYVEKPLTHSYREADL